MPFEILYIPVKHSFTRSDNSPATNQQVTYKEYANMDVFESNQQIEEIKNMSSSVYCVFRCAMLGTQSCSTVVFSFETRTCSLYNTLPLQTFKSFDKILFTVLVADN
ncbi:uncharacterized protein LOC141912365 [Tubulanus polymorphus]|uniref:uncharacterized protein LOC141912365 n=1 Tax=Tubulanus polymorphus TaxID=672921 RepID=UPI003DA3657E